MLVLGSVQAEIDGVERNKSFPPGSKSSKFRVTLKSEQVELVLLVDDPRSYVPGEKVYISITKDGLLT